MTDWDDWLAEMFKVPFIQLVSQIPDPLYDFVRTLGEMSTAVRKNNSNDFENRALRHALVLLSLSRKAVILVSLICDNTEKLSLW